MKSEKWDIFPYIGGGALTFGMGQDEARNILGKEILKDLDKDRNETILYWKNNALQIVFDSKGLSMIGFYPGMDNIFIEDVSLDWNDTVSVFNWLLSNDPSAMTDAGIFIFFKYGISASGLGSEGLSEKSVTVFREDVWSRDDSLLKPVDKSELLAN